MVGAPVHALLPGAWQEWLRRPDSALPVIGELWAELVAAIVRWVMSRPAH